VRRADNLTTFMCRLSQNLGNWTSWNPMGLSRPVMDLLYLYLYLYLPSTPGSYKPSIFLKFLQLNLVNISSAKCSPPPLYCSWFDHSNNVQCGVQIIKFNVINFPQVPGYFFHLRPDYLPQQAILESSQSMLVPDYDRPSGTPIKQHTKL
jgi:hypothetical protein